MFKLSTNTVESIEKTCGYSMNKLRNHNYIIELAQSGKKIGFSRKRDTRLLGRGNPYLARKRFTTIYELEKKVDNIYAEIKKKYR